MTAIATDALLAAIFYQVFASVGAAIPARSRPCTLPKPSSEPSPALVEHLMPPSSSQVAMLVEVELDDGKIAAGLFAHRKLSESVGFSIAAFARCLCRSLHPHKFIHAWPSFGAVIMQQLSVVRRELGSGVASHTSSDSVGAAACSVSGFAMAGSKNTVKFRRWESDNRSHRLPACRHPQ